MKLLQTIKDFRKWRKERKMSLKVSRCDICAYNNPKCHSYCTTCLNGVDDDWFTPRLEPTSVDRFADIVIRHILGQKWMVVDSLSKEQILAIAADEILKKVKI